MKRHLALVALVAAAFGCKSESDSSGTADVKPAPAKAAQADRAKPVTADAVGGANTQVQIGDGDRRELPFEITAVHTDKAPSDAAPWHKPGGAWTFIEAKTKTATFRLGLESQPLEGVPFERATAMLVVSDKAAALALVTELATALKTKAPTSVEHAGKPLKMNGVVLGRGQARTANGYGGKGDWVTCKWTIEGTNAAGEPSSAEVFFNFNLATKRGVFGEKDSIYNEFLIESLATRL